MSTTDEDLIDIVELSLVSVERRKRKDFLIAKYKPTTCAGNKTSNTSQSVNAWPQ
jgi:hypothetical protein